MADPIDAAALRKWATETNARLDALEDRPTDHGVGLGLPFRVVPKRQRGPYSQEQLAARMVRNGASPQDAEKWAAEILANNARGATA